MIKKNNFYLFLLILFCFSCDSQAVFDEYKSFSNAWNKDEIVSFNVNPNDSINPYNLFVNVRNTNAYKYKNLFLIVEMDFPNGKVVTDTLEYNMADKTGALLGEGISTTKTSKLWYKEAVKFLEHGDYKVKIQHAMRKNGEVNGVVNLEGITDIGFRIEKIIK
ncbi:gliding motility lipoprotein GldH [Aurantibacter sp.]|uniref:gliding motility lipoprotein GldH n=1 Tax=Aurantibacter sp. TaxID=2807103 RepID=UPI0035C7FBD3